MSTIEILAKAAAKTPRYDASAGGFGDLTWQDVLQALQGVNLAKTSFALFLITGDKSCKHYFWAGLFMEALARRHIYLWSKQHTRAVDALCALAVMEWGDSRKYTQARRAALMGVSRSAWRRKYRSIYHEIRAIPDDWRRELEGVLRNRLR